jgi:hypothetical protein
MSANSGYVVTYRDREGKQQTGIVRHREQHSAISSRGKVLINPLKGNGAPVLKEKALCTIVGFVD